MACELRMKTIYLLGLLWLYLLGFGYMALSLEPGFLDFDNLPDTNFSCVGKVIGGYYADLETNCQMFHVCTIGQLDEPMDIRFLCLNGTVFDQETRVCERIDEVDCSKSEKFYSLNLELYGNTQPSILEESASETEQSLVIKATTTTTTTTTQRPKPKTTRPSFFSTVVPPTITTAPKVISTHHFPISNQPDIRFNPEEINISLNPGAPPDIRTKPLSFQEQIFSSSDNLRHHNNKKAIVTTDISYDSDDDKDIVHVLPLPSPRPLVATTTQKPKSVVSYGLIHDKPQVGVTPSDYAYTYPYHGEEYLTDRPSHANYQYHYRPSPHGQFRNQFRTSTYRSELLGTTRKTPFNSHAGPTTFRNPFLASLKPPSYSFRTEKPQRLQLPLPLLPTLPPLTFSSPAPFSLGRHIETKRYTNEHLAPPRIIVSASASVSDASGRRLNYSLGTIGVPLLEEPPKSYDDYKDHDVVLDPFYHDVPKVKKSRSKRQIKHSDVIKSEQEAVDVLKFLFDWYKANEKTSTTVSSGDSTEKLLVTEDGSYHNSDLFQRKSKFNIVGDVLSVTEAVEEIVTPLIEPKRNETPDYVDDNYEPLTYQISIEESRKNATEAKENITARNEEKEYGRYHVLTKEFREFIEATTKSKEIDVVAEITTTTVRPTRGRARGRSRQSKEMMPSLRRGRSRFRATTTTTTEAIVEEILTTEKELEVPTTTTEEIPTTQMNAESTTISFVYESETEAIVSKGEEVDQKSLNEEVGEDSPVAATQFDSEHEATSVVNAEEYTESDPTEPIVTQTIEPEVKSEHLQITHHMFDVEKHDSSNEAVAVDTTQTTPIVTTTSRYLSTVLESDINEKLKEVLTTTSKEESLVTTTEKTTTTNVEIEESTSTNVKIEETTTLPETTLVPTILTPVEASTEETSTRRNRHRTRPPRYKSSSNYRRPSSRHRFSTELFTSSRPSRRKPDVKEEIVQALTTLGNDPEVSTSTQYVEDVPATDASLYKSAHPTQAESFRETLITTPLSREKNKTFMFNCFKKPIDKFYSDPRDCRLFHYCTAGYTKNQLLDMKFVCDLGTYFDEEKLICTKVKPGRCL